MCRRIITSAFQIDGSTTASAPDSNFPVESLAMREWEGGREGGRPAHNFIPRPALAESVDEAVCSHLLLTLGTH